jgi:hypothetical protein
VDELRHRYSGISERLTERIPPRPVHAHRDGHHSAVKIAENLTLAASPRLDPDMADHVGDDVDRAPFDAANTDGLLSEEELGRLDRVAVDP